MGHELIVPHGVGTPTWFFGVPPYKHLLVDTSKGHEA